jgi:hypothetical protein
MKTTPEKVNALFLKPMLTMFAKPSHIDDEVAVLSQYSDELTCFREEVLISAWKDIRRTWQRHTWPSLARIIEACNEAARQHAVFREPESPQGKNTLRDRVMLSKVGQEAIKGGYATSLVDFISASGRAPTNAEIEKMKKSVVVHDLEISAFKNKTSYIAQTLCRIASITEEREAQLAEKYKIM